MTKPSILDVTIDEAFEMGKFIGKQDILKELEELAIIDPNFRMYIKARIKSLDDTCDIMKKYKILMKVRQ